MKKLLYFFFFLFVFLFPISAKTDAQEFKTDYAIQYFLSQQSQKISAEVRFNIKITHLSSNTYVKKFSLSYPQSFQISDLTAYDDNGVIAPKLLNQDGQLKIELEFSNPSTGKGSENTFYLNFKQDNLFKVNGNIWEVIIPLIENRENSTYKVIVNLPPETEKKISLAKPKPDSIVARQIVWNDPQTRTIYAVFGDTQLYKMELVYHLVNPKVIPVYTDIAFPPDTLYQKTYVESIRPLPNLVFTDEDGNYMGRYFLNPGEKKLITYSGTAEIKTTPREDMFAYEADKMEQQKSYLLSETALWKIAEVEKFKRLQGPRDIYDFVVKTLSYDYKKIGENNHRLGADKALREPTHAVCLEFTDLFIALAREKGILSREIQGFGFSQDETLRPLSFLNDVLHSWPEYYDEKNKIWVPVDPTWENTSGIDYFSSLDLNHIALAIHGKKSDYPYPGGMYKEGNSQDVSIKPTVEAPRTVIDLSVVKSQISDRINDGSRYTGSFLVKNNSSVFLRKVPVTFFSDDLLFEPSAIEIASLAPLEQKEFTFQYRSRQQGKQKKTSIEIKTPYGNLSRSSITIMPYYFDLSIKILFIALPAILLFILWKRR